MPGGEKPQDCDYYWSMYHDRMHNTFVDSFVEAPPSKAEHAASKGPRVSPALGYWLTRQPGGLHCILKLAG